MLKEFLGSSYIYKVAAKIYQAFTADTTNIVTSNAHGLENGDVLILSSSDTLPAGLEVSTKYFVKNVTTNTFELALSPNGESITTTDAGTGTHSYMLQGKKIHVKDYRNKILEVFTSNNFSGSFEVRTSQQEDVDFSAAASPTNRWDVIEVIEKDNENQVAGSTGISSAGTDLSNIYDINDDHSVNITVQCKTYVAGNANVILSASSD